MTPDVSPQTPHASPQSGVGNWQCHVTMLYLLTINLFEWYKCDNIIMSQYYNVIIL